MTSHSCACVESLPLPLSSCTKDKAVEDHTVVLREKQAQLQEALDAVEEVNIWQTDVVLLDVGMCGGFGGSLCALGGHCALCVQKMASECHLSATGRHLSTPRVILRASGARAGAHAVLPKPPPPQLPTAYGPLPMARCPLPIAISRYVWTFW